MQKIAKFFKVSFDQFKKDWQNNFSDLSDVEKIYDNIKLPKRATAGSAGYDFFAPIKLFLNDFIKKSCSCQRNRQKNSRVFKNNLKNLLT